MRAHPTREGLDLTAIPWLRRLLVSRWPQWIATALALTFALYAVLAGLFGTEVGNRNLGITLVWIAWWATLMLILVPLGGRLWCSVCPIPAPGDWFQRGGLMAGDGRVRRGLGLRWPRRLRNLWPQNVGFLLLASMSTLILTRPRLSAALLFALVALAFAVSVAYERRTFCRFLCPVGGFIGIYALPSPLALRVRDPEICRSHPTMDCYRGSQLGHGCPWMVFPATLDRNAACGLCMECLRTCPLDNVSVLLRRPGLDLLPEGPRPPMRMDEAYKGFIMVTAAGVYSAVLMGPWGELKAIADRVGSLPWIGYVAAFLGIALVALPGLYVFAAWLGRLLSGARSSPLRARLLRSAAGLVPLGLSAWITFSLAVVPANSAYVLATLSDPLGLGWDLFGTAALEWQPILTTWVQPLQGLVLLGGLAWATALTVRALSPEADRPSKRLLGALPTLLVNGCLIGVFLGLYL